MGGGVDSHGHRLARPAIRHAKLKMLFVVIATNLVSVYLFSGASLSLNMPASAPSIHLWDSTALLRDLNATRDALSLARAELAFLRGQCGTSSLLLESVLAKLGAVHGDTPALNATYVPILDRVGFRRLRWKASPKLDLGAERNEWYVSALLEKPMG
ncbi:unnamed protein product [Triticum turgidum subsp. durum]|uniref:Uncharacterized protein n=1 Tax=Triticum turgidum subsp. durum TaxID=4567 RepID=A0A9R1NXK5_TRITD|nr:unnamed protein product [Triticum turgidum subsp. durum]